MIAFIEHSIKGKTIATENSGSEEQGVGYRIGYKGAGKTFRMTEMVHILIVVIVTQLYIFVNTRYILWSRGVNFIIYKSYLNEPEFLNVCGILKFHIL